MVSGCLIHWLPNLWVSKNICPMNEWMNLSLPTMWGCVSMCQSWSLPLLCWGLMWTLFTWFAFPSKELFLILVLCGPIQIWIQIHHSGHWEICSLILLGYIHVGTRALFSLHIHRYSIFSLHPPRFLSFTRQLINLWTHPSSSDVWASFASGKVLGFISSCSRKTYALDGETDNKQINTTWFSTYRLWGDIFRLIFACVLLLKGTL